MTEQTETVPEARDIVLEARGVSKHFRVRRNTGDVLARRHRAVHAVDDVSLKLRRGTVTALVGSPAPASPPSPGCSRSCIRSPGARYISRAGR